MLKKNKNKQQEIFSGTLDSLMPKEHFLRDLDKLVDFDFIYEKVSFLYSDKGRPSVDPVVIIKMLLISYFYGIDSERRLQEEVNVNIAYRWFLRIGLNDSVPDHSTFSQLRRRKFKGTNVFEEIFDEIVCKCIEAGIVDGKLLLTDSTHIRANADNSKREIVTVPDTPTEYMKKLDKEAYETGLISQPVTYASDKTKNIVQSTTDPESGLLNRPGKPKAFCYLSHQTCDAKNGIITDVFVTPGNVNDCTPHTERLEYQIEKFGFETEAVCADGGYDNSEVYHAMQQRNIKTYIPRRKKSTANSNYAEDFDSLKFTYNSERNVYICPTGKELHFSCYNKKSRLKRYLARITDCRSCVHREKCMGKSKNARMIERNMHEEARQEQLKNVNTPEYFSAMRLRQIWCEGNFSHQKERHNLRRTRKRGIEKVTEQCLLSACALNLKRLVKCLNELLFYFDILLFYSFDKNQTDFLFSYPVFVNSAILDTPNISIMVKY